MLILVSVFMALNALLVVLACSFGCMFFERNRLQSTADEIALAGARKLNENDRLGQMNNMVARCRQLVYASRQTYTEVDSSYDHLRHLAEQLMNESRDSAVTLEQERQALNTLTRQESQAAMQSKFAEIKNTYALALPWLKVDMPHVDMSDVGKLSSVDCNAVEMTGFDDLVNADRSAGYLHNLTDMHLYKDHTNAHLTGADSDLSFKFSSLPAPVGDAPSASDPTAAPTNVVVAPARAVLANKFKNVDQDELPSACQVKLKLHVATSLGVHGESDVVTVGTSAAMGGSIPM